MRTNSTPAGALYYQYDNNGNLTNLSSSTANGVFIAYGFDALNRVTNIVDNRLTGSKNTSYAFDAAGSLTAMRYPNGATNLWEYDSRNRLTNVLWKLNATTLGSFFYRLEATGCRTNLDETVNGGPRSYNWQYDALHRLTNETISSLGSLAYRYDLVGNRTNRQSTVTQLPNANYGYTTNDWLATDVYDNNGNTRTNGASVYQYDYANRLTNANNGAVVITYDADGHRIRKVAGGTTTLYLVDSHNLTGYAQVVEELTVSGGITNLARAYTYGLDLISQRAPNVSTNFFGYDGLGSTRFLLNPGGAITETYAYDAYGNLIASNGPPSTAYLYGGEQFDANLGFYYLRARYLNPGTGRFWTMDSFEGNSSDPLSLHKYLYAQANPANRIDPSGHFSGIELSIASTMAVSLHAMYDGTGSGIGAALQASIFGAEAGKSMNDVLTEFILDETGISAVMDMWDFVKQTLMDGRYEEEDAYLMAYQAWQEEVLFAVAMAIPDEAEASEYEIEFVPQCFVAGTPVAGENGLRSIESIRPGEHK